MANDNRRSRRKSKIYLRSTVAGLLIAGTIFTGAKIAAKTITVNIESKPDHTIENTIGYDNIGVHHNDRVHPNNFVVLPISRSNIDLSSIQDKMDKCNRLGIDLGIVLDTNPQELSDFYLDYDYMEAITMGHDITLPIYLNIDNIMENPRLDNNDKLELITEFVKRAEASNLYYGFKGTDSNINNCNKYIYNLTNTNVYLIKEGTDTQFKGNYTITKELDGFIKCNYNIAQARNNNKVVLPSKYEVKDTDTIDSIALRFGISVLDIKNYNDINEIHTGDILYIPNNFKVIDKDTNMLDYSYAIARGVDICDYQDHIDWDVLSNNADYCIIGLARDPKNYSSTKGTFLSSSVNQIYEAYNHNMAVGLYLSVEEDMKISVYRERFNSYLQRLDNELSYNNIAIDKANIPIFINFINYFENNNYYELMSMVEEVAKAHGYNNVGLYCNGYMLDRIILDLHDLDGNKKDINDTNWFVWRAGGQHYIGYEHDNDYDISINDLQEPEIDRTKPYSIDIEQVTNVCNDSGAGNYLGHSDVSYLFDHTVFGNALEYKLINNGDSSDLYIDISKYKNIPINNIIYYISNAISVAYIILSIAVISGLLVIRVQEKNKNMNPVQKVEQENSEELVLRHRKRRM